MNNPDCDGAGPPWPTLKVYLPICRECGEAIEGTSYNFRCGSCAQALAREEMQDIGKHVQKVSNE